MNSKKPLIVFLVAFLIIFIALQLFRSTGPVGVGKAAPRFTLSDMAGREVSLDEYKGKIEAFSAPPRRGFAAPEKRGLPSGNPLYPHAVRTALPRRGAR